VSPTEGLHKLAYFDATGQRLFYQALRKKDIDAQHLAPGRDSMVNTTRGHPCVKPMDNLRKALNPAGLSRTF
jgi:hypothetical protein